MGCIGSRTGFLSRLARDVRGNTLAIMAAALIPLAGLIGGGVDMSRLYLVKTRLQQACDAGALAGRKAMGPDSWTEGSNNGSTNDKAEKMFGANFSSGQYGSSGLTKSFSESNGVVSGQAGLTMPMTIMKIFGMTSRNISVTCQAKMELPNTDVMFVLDVTGSMNCVAGASCPNGNNNNVPAVGAKIFGLKSAVKCFYEALLKVNTTEVCGNDPTATTSTTTAQIRIGFVPYSVSVNVGRLLPNDYLANSWRYQSREPVIGTAHAWSIVTQASPADSTDSTLKTVSWNNNWTTPTPTNTFFSTSNYNSMTTVAGNNTDTFLMADGRSLVKKNTNPTNSSTCDQLNIYGSGSSKMTGVQQTLGSTGNTSSTPTNNNPPVWVSTSPANPNTQNQSISHSRTNTVNTGFKYVWTGGACYLQSATIKTNVTKTYVSTETGTGTKQIAWTDYPDAVISWNYKAMTFNVGGLKAGSSSWNNSVLLPIGYVKSGPSVTLSNSLVADQVPYPADATVTWDGCIEERDTVKNSDYDPSNEWWPIPSTAFDMNIDMLPNAGTAGSVWGPALQNAVWARFNPKSDCTSNGDTTNTVNTACDLSHNTSYYCTTPASKLTVYNTATNFETYVNSLTAIGNTYHDIGMLWGARLISPTGIFASENSASPSSGPIQRHIIFMTDGDTMTDTGNYTAYGVGWWDRRQTTYAPSSTNLNNIVNARLDSLCTTIKNMNITLWVISYGGGINATTESRLKRCSTGYNTVTQQDDGIHYKSAAATTDLVAQFKAIAAKISELRLTH